MTAQVNITSTITPGCDVQPANCGGFVPEIIARFWSLVQPDPQSDCLLFIGPTQRGYGIFSVGKDRIRAHRLAWLLAHGSIPAGAVICHACDNPPCVNVAHLRADSQAGNIRESVRKARKNSWGHQKLAADDVRAIRHLIESGARHKDIGLAFGIARNTVSQIGRRKCWAHLVS